MLITQIWQNFIRPIPLNSLQNPFKPKNDKNSPKNVYYPYLAKLHPSHPSKLTPILLNQKTTKISQNMLNTHIWQNCICPIHLNSPRSIQTENDESSWKNVDDPYLAKLYPSHPFKLKPKTTKITQKLSITHICQNSIHPIPLNSLRSIETKTQRKRPKKCWLPIFGKIVSVPSLYKLMSTHFNPKTRKISQTMSITHIWQNLILM